MCLTFRPGIGQLLIVALMTLGLGCGSKPAAPPITQNPAPTVPVPPNAPPPTNTVEVSPISDEECITFARELEKNIVAGNADGASAMLDWSAMLDEAFAGLSTGQEPVPFLVGMRQGTLRASPDFYRKIIAETKDGGSYRFLRVKSAPEGKRVQFRYLASQQRGLNYHEILIYRKDHKCIGRDIEVYTIGERQSQMMRRVAILGISKSDPGGEMVKAMNSGRYADALAAYYRLPMNLQREKSYLLNRLRAAMQVSVQEITAAIDAFHVAHPDDSAADLNFLYSLILQDEFVAARQSLDRIEKSVGGDPFLDVLRARFFVKESKFAEAEAAAQRAIAGDTTLTDAWMVRLEVSVKTREFARTAELMTTLQKVHGIQFPDLATLPFYAEFVKSPEYQEWQAEKAKNP